MTPTLEGHLDGCLGCLNCQHVCPSEVDYGRIIDGVKALRMTQRPAVRRGLWSLAIGALSSARVARILVGLSRLYARSGIARLASLLRLDRIPRWRTYQRLAGSLADAGRQIEAREPDSADADLFLGCMGAAAQGRAIEATLEVASHLGLRLRIHSADACCGAMLRHNGLPVAADAQRDACAQRYAGRPLIGLASACVAELRDHPALTGTDELCAYLASREWPPQLTLQPMRRRVLVHEPCSHRNQLGGNAAVYSLLARIPGLEIAALPTGHGCCGAAGTYLLQQPRMADALVRALLEPLASQPPDVIVTTNPGCALHLAAGVREAGLQLQVLHPVELVAAALATPTLSADARAPAAPGVAP
jgi:glycolate oxidase iron-sulfur subunit